MSKPKYLITNLVYGDAYTKLFCNNHVKSLVDPSNLPALKEKYAIEYAIFSDQDTVRTLSFNPYVAELSKHVKLSTQLFAWPDSKINRFQLRYTLLVNMFQWSVKKALAEGSLLTCWVADLVVAKEFFSRIMSKMEAGHGAVFVLPLRAASEAATPVLNQSKFALSDVDLFNVGYECLHPLWNACHWDNPQFTKLPFTLLWPGQGGLLARTFSTTPIVFRPTKAMLETRGMIDGDIPQHCDNPYWAEDWTDAPVIGVEPLICYYPPFANRPASAKWVGEWASCIHPSQVPFLEHRCYYPSKKAVTLASGVLERSDKVVGEIIATFNGVSYHGATETA